MPIIVDSRVEVPVSSLPSQVLELAQKHVKSVSGAIPRPEHDWAQITFAPTARYLYDPGHQAGAASAYVELRVLGPRGPEDARGYILISLTEEDYPVPEFATSGAPKTDTVAQVANSGTINKFMRSGPAYVVGEDAAGGQLCALGTPPLKATGPLPPREIVVGGSDTIQSVVPQRSTFNAAPAASYQDLKEDFQTNPVRIQARAQRAKDTAASWRLAKGIRNPTLQLHVGETLDFLTDKTLTAAAEVVLGAREVLRILALPKGGFRATGVSAGSVMVRVQEQNGSVDFHTVTVSVAVQAGHPDITTRDLPVNMLLGIAGTDWNGDQRQFDQLKNDQWCPLDGCGPTALAMMFGWWDVNGVPSAFYRLKKGFGDAHHFRFDYESLRGSDAPKNTISPESQAIVVPVYDDLHKLSNTICWSTSELGSTPPDQLVSAFQEYVDSRVSTIAE
jgi:hypothetical protein